VIVILAGLPVTRIELQPTRVPIRIRAAAPLARIRATGTPPPIERAQTRSRPVRYLAWTIRITACGSNETRRLRMFRAAPGVNC
jgi:hypothetical protein